MLKGLKKLFALLLVFAMIGGMCTVPVQAASVSYDKKVTAYMCGSEEYVASNPEGNYYPAHIDIKNATGKPKSVKSSNSKIVKVVYKYYDSSTKTAGINLAPLKAGTATISFKIGSKTYSTKVTVKPYTVPASTIKISGVKSGKNLVNQVKEVPDCALNLSKKTKNATLTVKAKSGWNLTFVGVDAAKSSSAKTIIAKSFKGTSKKQTFDLGTLTKKKTYRINLEFENKKNGAKIELYYEIN